MLSQALTRCTEEDASPLLKIKPGMSQDEVVAKVTTAILQESSMLEIFLNGTGLDQAAGAGMMYELSHPEMTQDLQNLAAKYTVPKSEDFLNEQMKTAFDPDRGYGKLVLDVMENYFNTDKLDDGRGIDRRGMVASFLRYTRTDAEGQIPPGEALGAIFKGAGPILQKALQGLDISGSSPELAQAVKDMKSSLAPIDPQYVKAQLLDLVERSRGNVTNITITKSLGAASVGQAFLCEVTKKDGTKQTCVLKLLRPDVRNKAMRERELFESIAEKIPGMKATFAGQLERILAELDLTTEASNAMMGQLYTNDEAGVQSMTILDTVPPSSGALLLECAPGKDLAKTMESSKAFLQKYDINSDEIKTLDELKALDAHIQDLRNTHTKLTALSRKWVEEGIFGKNGFYHGDLHAGNIMIDAPDPNAPGDPRPQVGKMTVIDYGNATKLSSEQRKNVLVVMASATFQRADWFLDGYLKLLDQTGRDEFAKKDVVETDKEGYLMTALGERALDKAGKPIRVSEKGFVCKVKENGEIVETSTKAMGRLTAMLDRIVTSGETKDVGKRIAVALTKFQEQGIDCPGAIFNFSACQIRLQNAVEGLAEQIKTAEAVLSNLADKHLEKNYPRKDRTDEIKESQDFKTLEGFCNTEEREELDDFLSVVGEVLAGHKTDFISSLGFFRAREAMKIQV